MNCSSGDSLRADYCTYIPPQVDRGLCAFWCWRREKKMRREAGRYTWHMKWLQCLTRKGVKNNKEIKKKGKENERTWKTVQIPCGLKTFKTAKHFLLFQIRKFISCYKICFSGRDSSVVTVTRLRVGWFRVRIAAGERNFSSLPKRPQELWEHTPSYSFGRLGSFPLVESGRVVRLITVFQLAPTSRMSGAILPLPLYVFIACALFYKTRHFTW